MRSLWVDLTHKYLQKHEYGVVSNLNMGTENAYNTDQQLYVVQTIITYKCEIILLLIAGDNCN